MRDPRIKVNIIGLSLNAHQFDFQIGDSFFEVYGQAFLKSGNFSASVTLDKRETMIEANFHIEGTAQLTCDRSLEVFDHPMTIDKKILFKYGQEEKELSDEIVVITREQPTLDIGQFLYELIAINVPMKRLHPKFRQDEQEESEIRLVYTTTSDESEEEAPTDPRWEKLKKLK